MSGVRVERHETPSGPRFRFFCPKHEHDTRQDAAACGRAPSLTTIGGALRGGDESPCVLDAGPHVTPRYQVGLVIYQNGRAYVWPMILGAAVVAVYPSDAAAKRACDLYNAPSTVGQAPASAADRSPQDASGPTS